MRIRSYIRRSKRGRKYRVKAHTRRDRKSKLRLKKIRMGLNPLPYGEIEIEKEME